MDTRTFAEFQSTLITSLNDKKTSLKTAKQHLLEDINIRAEEIIGRPGATYKSLKLFFNEVRQSTLLNTHANPNMDRRLKIERTASTQKAMGIIRKIALRKFFAEQEELLSRNEFATIYSNCEEAFKDSIFNLPRQNWFQKFVGMTDAQHQICEYQGRIEKAKEAYENANPNTRQVEEMLRSNQV